MTSKAVGRGRDDGASQSATSDAADNAGVDGRRRSRPPRSETLVARWMSILVLLTSILYLVGALQLNWGSMDRPGVGFFPSIVAVGLLLAVVTDLISSARSMTNPTTDSVTDNPDDRQLGDTVWRIPAILGILTLYFVLVSVVGHLVAAAGACAVVVKLLSAWKWWQAAIAGAAVSAGSVLVFDVLLGMRLPG